MTRRDRPPDRPSLGSTVGPERVAAILSVLVIAVVATVALGGVNGGSAPPGGSASSAPPTAPGSVTSTIRPANTTEPSSPPSAVAWTSGASTLIEIHDQMIVARDRLAAAVAAPATPTSEIARELRALNTAITTAQRAVDTLRAQGAPDDLADDLATTHQAALDAGVQTLQASLQNDPAYRTGGGEVVAALKGLEDLTQRLRTGAGLP